MCRYVDMLTLKQNTYRSTWVARISLLYYILIFYDVGYACGDCGYKQFWKVKRENLNREQEKLSLMS